jgi:non-specific serine/threonine protein kinase
VQLFVARASGVWQEFSLAPGDAAVVAEICRRLDGLPLAIELAAAWMRVLTPAALLARLTERLPLLAGGNADQPERFQTMRAAIRWSYDLLTPEEALTLRRLSVFRGGFTLEAAAHVVLSPDESATDTVLTILHLVAILCDKSLLAPADAFGEVQRFTMLETVREFAYEQLAGTDDLARTNAAHAEYFRDWLEQIEPDFFGPREEHWCALVAAEVGNIHLALYRGILHDAELAQRMGASLWAYWALQSPGEGLRWLNGAISAPGSTTARVRSRAFRTAGAMAVLIGNYGVAASLGTEALELALQASAPWLEGEARWILGLCDIFAGNFEQAEHHLTCAVAMLDPAPTPTEITISAYVRSALGIVAFLRGNRAWGLELYDRAVSELRPAGGASVPIIVFTDYAGWLIMLERLPQARQLLNDALHLARRTPTSWLIGGILVCLALADAMEGHAASAAHKLGAVEGIRTSRGITVPVQYQQRVDRATVLAHASLEPSAFAEAYDHGRLNPGEIVEQLLSGSASPAVDGARQQAARQLGLTRRECDVLPYLVAGMSDREIATNLFISHRTASAHVGRILQRLGAATRADAAVRAVRLGLV